MHRITRRGLLASAVALPAMAQSAWPDRPVRIVVPFPPGGSNDIVTRLLAEALQARLGQPFLVENRGGAGGNIGADAVAKAAPDGHTLLLAAPGPFAINEHLYRGMPFDPARTWCRWPWSPPCRSCWWCRPRARRRASPS